MYSARIKCLKYAMSEKSLDGVLVTKPHHIFYLTGLFQFIAHPQDAYLYLGAKKNYLFTNKLYAGGIEKSSLFDTFVTSVDNPFPKALSNIVRHGKLNRVGVAMHDISHYEYTVLKKNLQAELISCDGMIEAIRIAKDSSEIESIRNSCRLTDQAFASLLNHLRTGLSEIDIARIIENYIRDHGGSLAFPPIVAFDAHAATPHHSPQNTHLTKDTKLILIDVGAQLEGYCSDLTRVIFPIAPTSSLKSTYSSLRRAQTETISYIGNVPPWTSFSDISMFCSRLFEKYELPDIPHSLGHGLGIEVHEKPHIHPRSQEILEKNMIFTIEPGVYVSGKYGMRIEDTVCYTSGGIERLTQTSSSLLVKSL